jgi:hypothetical protein
MKKARVYTVEELVKEYQSIREEHGDQAKLSTWMDINGYQWLMAQANRKYGLKWGEFKDRAGFKNENSRRRLLPIEDLVKKYKKISDENGDFEKGTTGQDPDCAWLYQQVTNGHSLRWEDFKKQCGYRASKFKKYPLDELIKEYQSIREKNGDQARVKDWMIKNGYSWITSQIYRKHNLGWQEFKIKAGYNDFAKKNWCELRVSNKRVSFYSKRTWGKG